MATSKKKRATSAAKKTNKPAAKAPSAATRALARVDPAMQKRYEELLAEISHADTDAMRGFDRKYEAVGEVLDSKLYLLSPYGTPEKWTLGDLGEKYRSARRNVRVAQYCSPDDEHRYGTAKLDAVLTYLDAKTHGLTEHLPVALAKLRIPVTRGGKALRLSIEDATFDEINAAAKGDRAGTKGSRRSPVEAAFAAALAKDKELAKATVRVRDGSASFGAVALTALDRFAKALRGVDWRKAVAAEGKK